MHFQDFATNWFGLRHVHRNNQAWFCHTHPKETFYRKSSVKPPGGPAYLFQTHLKEGGGGA